MSSGSLKDLSRAITNSSAQIILPLPEDLCQVITAYLDKHSTQDESDSQRLQEELLNVYQTSFLEHPARLAPFLRVLRILRPVLQGAGRSLQWWDKLSTPVMIHLGVEKGLAFEARDTLLEILNYDEEETSDLEDARLTSEAVADNLLGTWLEQTEISAGDLNEHAAFVVKHVQAILIAFGKRKPKAFLESINKAVVKKSSRILALSLLCEFFRHQPPHLHQMLQTPLFDNLLQCLQVDTSTRSISLAITALIMFLPHIPISASNHLPALFNIYSRLLFWDRERKAADILPRNDVETGDGDTAMARQLSSNSKGWDKLSYLLDSEDDSVPELLHYFTFLYGLYPIHFMDYIRKPQRYLRHANFPGADDLDIEPAEIRQRSELFRQVHLLHPNFFRLTYDSELTDQDRWKKSEAADVVAECMALYVPSEEGVYAISRSRGPIRKIELNGDVPDQSLLESETATPGRSRHTSWRNTQSTAVALPETYRPSALQRRISQTSQSMPSMADSPLLHPSDRNDSPTLPPQLLGSPSNNRLSDLLGSQRSVRGSVYQALTNDSVGSLSLSNHNQESNVDAYLDSLTRDDLPRSPSLRPTTNETAPALKVAYLEREITLLRNDLNFERYLKQQHLSHIGQLRRKQIREARVEAETQNLLNSNRTLKSKLEDAKKLNVQMKKEHEKSKTHSRNWEGELSAKLRVLREEQKKWKKEREELSHELNMAKRNVATLKQITVETEARELNSSQKVASVEGSLSELERLRVEVQDLQRKVMQYEAGELAALRAKENEETALNRMALLDMELRSRDAEVTKTKQAFDAQLETARSDSSDEKPHPGNVYTFNQARVTQEVINNALAASRTRNNELQNAHNHLLQRYTSLESMYLDQRERIHQLKRSHDTLLSGGGPSSYSPRSSTPNSYHQYSPVTTEHDSLAIQGLGFSGNSMHSLSVDTEVRTRSPERSPTTFQYPGMVQHFQAPQPLSFGPTSTSSDKVSLAGSGSSGEGRPNTGKPKINPNSELRIYGRGGPQNIGKKKEDKEAKDKGKPKDAKDGKDTQSPEPKKEKKTLGLRGIRGFFTILSITTSRLCLKISAFIAFVLFVFAALSPFVKHVKTNFIPTHLSDQTFIKAPKQNVWSDLSHAEADAIATFLLSESELNLTDSARATGEDNSILLVELLQPNKTDVLSYLNGTTGPPSRWAHAVIEEGTGEIPRTANYMVGPLPLDEYSVVMPLEFCYSSGRNYAVNPLAYQANIESWATSYSLKIADVLEELLSDDEHPYVADGVTAHARIQYIEGSSLMIWMQFYRKGTISDATSLLPQGLYIQLNASTKYPENWSTLQYYYNSILYPNETTFRLALSSANFQKTKLNLDGDWTSLEDFTSTPPGRSLPPPVTIQPHGPRYKIDKSENYISWMGFTFYLSTRSSTGLALHNILFNNESIIHELSLQEALSHYAGSDPTQGGQEFLDSFLYMGLYMYALVPGYDCPPYATYLDASFNFRGFGKVNRGAVCVFEFTGDAPLQRHTADHRVSVGRNTYLVVRFVSTVWNYDYLLDYIFYLDGTVEVKVRASGFIIAAFWMGGGREGKGDGEGEGYGYRVHDAVETSMHDHVINFKADLDIAGTRNTMVRIGVEPFTKEYPWDDEHTSPRNTMHLVTRTVDKEAGIDWPKNSGEMIVVLNEDERNKWGEKRGYRIVPGTGMGTPSHLTILNSTTLGKAARWAERDLWVVRRKDEEPMSSSPLNALSPLDPIVDFSKFVDGEETVRDDLVVFFNLGSHHVPHSGDIPNTLMHTSSSSIMFTPFNFHDHDPSIHTRQGVKIEGGKKARHFGASYTEGMKLEKEDLEPDLSEYQVPVEAGTNHSFVDKLGGPAPWK